MKRYIRIGTALGIGALIIVGAVVLRASAPTPQEEGAVVAIGAASEALREYIRPTDSNDDGVKDWEEELIKLTVGDPATLPEFPSVDGMGGGEPKTLTDQFARSFFEEYTRGNLEGRLTKENQAAFLSASISSLEAESRDTLYTAKDIRIGEDSEFSVRNYGNAIADITYKYSVESENELIILERAIAAEDASALASLEPIANGYQNFITATLNTPVPPQLVTEHLNLINTYQAILSDIEGMQKAYDDPLYALVRIKRYQDDVNGLYYAFLNIYTYLAEAGVTYANDEPAAKLGIWPE